MKTKLLMLATVLTLGIMSATLKAQTSVTISYAGDSSWGSYCPPPVQAWINVSGMATGYNASTDSISVYMNFGDGHDTTIKSPLYQTWYGAYCYHTYTAKGIYNVQYIATGPDGKADTLIVPAEIAVGDSCGNISGKVYLDANGDCQYNSGEVEGQYMPVQLIYNGNIVGWTYTDSVGNYFFSGPSGNTYTIMIGSQLANFGYTAVCPVSGQYVVSSFPATGNDFGLTCTSGFDLQAYLWSQRFRPGFTSYMYPYYLNGSCMPVTGQVKLLLDDPRLTFVAAQNAPDLISGDTLIWNFSNSNNSNYWNWWNSYIGSVQVLTDVNAVLGDSICMTLFVTPLSGDMDPTNNAVKLCKVISNSLDPNIKEVAPQGIGGEGHVPAETDFTYSIQFQNTGTDTAYNIYILDTLDADLDMNTFTPIASSHHMKADILPGNVARFTFSNIMLVDSFKNEPLSHGWVSYKISAKKNLPNGTQIKNTAGIYFDFNTPVITNTTLNTIDLSLAVNEHSSVMHNITVYPNPASNQVLVTLTEEQVGAQLILIDALGQEVISQKTTGQDVNLNVSRLPAGIYNLILRSDNQISSGKIVLVK